jgi:hypothetical protein
MSAQIIIISQEWSSLRLPFNGVHADYHKKTDTPDKIEYDFGKRAQLAFTVAWELANRENKPVVNKK